MPAEPDGNYINPITVTILILLYVLGGIYAFSEAYFRNINENKLKHDADSGNKNAKKLIKILEKRSEMFSTVQFGLFFNGLFASALSAVMFTPAIIRGLNWENADGAFWAAILSVLIISSLLFFVFSDFLPKKVASHRSSKTTYRAVPLMSVFNSFFVPYMYAVNLLTDGVLRIFGYDPKNLEETVTEEEIMMLVGESEEKGVIEETEKDMIENILDFNDTTASEIMTHRTDIEALADTATIEELVALSVEEGFSRIPVYHEDIDSIIGICYVKDLLPYVGKNVPDFIKIKDIVRPAYFIPETKKCSQLFSEMTERKVQIAIIVDEYGGTSGLISLEDLVESILGNIQDEYDNEDEEIFRVNDNEFTVDGTTSIDEVSDLTDTELPEGDYDTIAGFVTEQLGRILKENEHPTILVMGLEITVLEVEDQRISKLLIKKLPVTEEDD